MFFCDSLNSGCPFMTTVRGVCCILRCLLKPNSITLGDSKLVRTSFEPASVMEFGFYSTRQERISRGFFLSEIVDDVPNSNQTSLPSNGSRGGRRF